MTSLDEFAAMSVADVRAEAAQIADTEAALADVHGEVQLVAAAPTGRTTPRRHRRNRFLMIGAAAAACVAVVLAAVVVGGDDQSVQPAVSPSTTEAAPTTTGDPVPSMSSPVWDEETGSEIVLQFTRQWEECPPYAYCMDPRAHFVGPMVTSGGRIILGEASSPGWLVAEDGSITKVPFDASWALKDAALAPDDSVYAVFVVGYEVRLYRYVGADMTSPELIGEPHPWGGAAAVVLDLGGTSGAERIEFADGVFTVHRPMFLAQPNVMPAHGGGHNLLVTFGDGTSHDYELVSPGVDDNAVVEATLHPLANSVVVIHGSAELPDAHQFLTVLLPDGSMRQRLLPFMQQVADNVQPFVDEGYYYVLTGETTTVGTSTTAVYSVRRFALPTEDEPPVVVPTTIAPTATTTPVPTQLTVSGDSLGGLEFGLSVEASLPQLLATLGEPAYDDSLEMPRLENGVWYDDNQNFFAHQFSRQVCWGVTSTLCAVFGGDAADSVQLVGWYARSANGEPSPIVTEGGIQHGSSWADHPEVVLDPPGSYTSCYSLGYGTTPDGIRVVLESMTSMFSSWDLDGNFVEVVPPAQEVTVVGMSAGEQVGTLTDDC